jgi:hypothetical protein
MGHARPSWFRSCHLRSPIGRTESDLLGTAHFAVAPNGSRSAA